MDRLIAANSVPLAQADTAPTTGTPECATDGNPATNVLATRWPSYQYNAIQEELIAILTAADIAPDRTNNAQITAAIKALIAQSAAVIGDRRNLAMFVTSASATATLSADEIVVGRALGGQKYVLANFSESINLATTGVGGMDTGTAPVSGFVALYAIYNPTTQTSALLATNAATKQGNVYGGANMPSGYTASALVSVWPTNASSQFAAGAQIDRTFALGAGITVLSTSTVQASPASLAITSSAPANAKTVSGQLSAVSTASSNIQLSVFASSTLIGGQGLNATAIGSNVIFRDLLLLTAQTLYWLSQNSTGTPTFTIVIWYYTI